MINIHVARQGVRYGPYTISQVRELLAAGRLSSDDLAWFEGAAGWMRLGVVPGVEAARPLQQSAHRRGATVAAAPVDVVYEYRPNLLGLAAATLFFLGGAFGFGSASLKVSRGVLWHGVFAFSKLESRVVLTCLAAVSTFCAIGGIVAIALSLLRKRQIRLTADALVTPRSLYSGTDVAIQWRDIRCVSVEEVRSSLFSATRSLRIDSTVTTVAIPSTMVRSTSVFDAIHESVVARAKYCDDSVPRPKQKSAPFVKVLRIAAIAACVLAAAWLLSHYRPRQSDGVSNSSTAPARSVTASSVAPAVPFADAPSTVVGSAQQLAGYPDPDTFAARWNRLKVPELLKISQTVWSNPDGSPHAQASLKLGGRGEVIYDPGYRTYKVGVSSGEDLERLYSLGIMIVKTLVPDISDAEMRELIKELAPEKGSVVYRDIAVELREGVLGAEILAFPKEMAPAVEGTSMIPKTLENTKCGVLANRIEAKDVRADVSRNSFELMFHLEHCDDRSSEGWHTKEGQLSPGQAPAAPSETPRKQAAPATQMAAVGDATVGSGSLGQTPAESNENELCTADAAPPRAVEETALTKGGRRHLTGRALRGGSRGEFFIVEAALGYDEQCRPDPYQIYVFRDGIEVGTLSTQSMHPRSEGAISKFELLDSRHLSLEIERRSAGAPACCSDSLEHKTIDLGSFGGSDGMQAGSIFESAQPSFDCRKASTATESAICGNPVLAGLDRDLGQAYKVALSAAGVDAKVVREDQREWIKNRDIRCNAGIACLGSELRQRIAQLARHEDAR